MTVVMFHCSSYLFFQLNDEGENEVVEEEEEREAPLEGILKPEGGAIKKSKKKKKKRKDAKNEIKVNTGQRPAGQFYVTNATII